MMKRVWVASVAAWVITVGAAQAQAPAPTASQAMRDAMARLKFLVGSWKGDCIMQMGPGPAEEVAQIEVVEAKLDGLVLLVEGVGTSRSTSKVVHQALGLISYNEATGQYRVVAYRQGGQSVDAKAKFLDDGSFQWGFDAGGRSVRYTISDRKGDWYETGEFSVDGKTWTRFLEMQLKRTS
jgi:hypothetical protein